MSIGYIWGKQTTNSELKTDHAMKRMGYDGRTPHWVQLLLESEEKSQSSKKKKKKYHCCWPCPRVKRTILGPTTINRPLNTTSA